jgi:hypothetical protein
VTCGAASFYAHKAAGFPGLKGKESCKKWHCSFFYVKNLKNPKIVQRIVALQAEGGLKASDHLLAFHDARMLPLQCRPHKMCFLGSNRDPSSHSSRALTAVAVAQKANRITEVKLPATWEWGLKPYDRNN